MGLGFAVPMLWQTRFSPEARLIAYGKSAIAQSLKDPDSAQFRKVRIHHAPLGAVVCGEVNAKNSMGGYVGFSRFYVNEKRGKLETDDDLDFALEWRQNCVDT